LNSGFHAYKADAFNISAMPPALERQKISLSNVEKYRLCIL
jgi:hypothetical protein